MTVFHRNEKKEPLPQSLRGGVIAIGNFDGVHRGHQSVLNRALERAETLGVPALVLTFEPHPRTVFNRKNGFPAHTAILARPNSGSHGFPFGD